MRSRSLLLEIFKVLGSGTRPQVLIALGPLGFDIALLVISTSGLFGQRAVSQCTGLGCNLDYKPQIGRRDLLE